MRTVSSRAFLGALGLGVLAFGVLASGACAPPSEPDVPLPPVQDTPVAGTSVGGGPASTAVGAQPAISDPSTQVDENAAAASASEGTMAVSAPDRSEADRALDNGRQPAKMIDFFGIKPGMRVAELGAGTGYTTELLARVVGPKGKVFAQNNQFILERFAAAPLAQRLQKPVMSNVVRVDQDFDAALPAEAQALDAVLVVLFYHDTVWFGVDRAAMNRAVYGALKPGGVYGIVDHSAAAGAGTGVAKSLHRLEESVVRSEIEGAGFRFESSAEFLRNPEDTRDWNASPSAAGEHRGTSDRFVLKFVKP